MCISDALPQIYIQYIRYGITNEWYSCNNSFFLRTFLAFNTHSFKKSYFYVRNMVYSFSSVGNSVSLISYNFSSVVTCFFFPLNVLTMTHNLFMSFFFSSVIVNFSFIFVHFFF